jgi:hypothetical protein
MSSQPKQDDAITTGEAGGSAPSCGSISNTGFRVGQKVCRLAWAPGNTPHFAFGVVTKTTANTYWVDGEKGAGWSADSRSALKVAYLAIFNLASIQFPFRDGPRMNARQAVARVVKLRRIEAKFGKTRKKK